MSATMPSSQGDQGAVTAYLKAIRTHPLVVLGVTLIAVAAAVAWLSRSEPSYEASAEVLVTPLAGDEGSLVGLQLLTESPDPTRVTQTAAGLIDSPRTAAKVAAALRPRYTRDRVEQAVDVEPRGQSNIVAVTAKAPNGRLAADLANRFATVSLELRNDVLKKAADARLQGLLSTGAPTDGRDVRRLRVIATSGDPTMSLAQRAVAPTVATGPPSWLVVLLAAIAGLGLGCGAAVLMEATNRRLRDAREIVDLHPLPVLARVPRVSRARLSRKAFPPAAREAYRTLLLQLERSAAESRVIAFVSANSGDGKTSSAVHLSLALAAAGRSVVLIDFDLRKPEVATALSIPVGRGLDSLLTRGGDLEDVLVDVPDVPGLRVATASPGTGDVLLMSMMATRLPDLLAQAREMADHVILDTAPLGEVSDALRVLPFTDEVVVVARPHNTQRADYEALLDVLELHEIRPAGLVLVAVGGLRGRYQAYGSRSRSDDAARRALARPGPG